MGPPYTSSGIRLHGEVIWETSLPEEYTVDQLREIGFREQITEHYRIQGGVALPKWGGSPTVKLLERVKPDPSARHAVFYSYADGANERALLRCPQSEQHGA